MDRIDELSIATIRSLVIDITNKANSGHPGMAIGSAPALYTLFTRHLNANSDDEKWINRDRFVLSAGHASALLYSMLHLCGYKVSLDDLKQFRQLHSITPGHPEVTMTPGIDATAGPLGQGIAQAVGMALAETKLQAMYKDGEKLINHYTYCLCGDGCLQEGISQEAISFAGHNKLNKLILIYDSNNVTLDGGLNLSFSEDVKARFIASGWNTLEVNDGNDIEEIDGAIKKAKLSLDKPTIIIMHTIIGFGTPKQGTSKVHGSPLGMEDGKLTKVNAYNFDHEDFFVPEEVYKNFKNTFTDRNQKVYEEYENTLKEYAKNNKEDYDFFMSHNSLDITSDINDVKFAGEEGSSLATRISSGKYLNRFSEACKCLIGGSADVAGSVMTKLDNGSTYSFENRNGNNINFGIREFAMGCIANGMLLHGGLRTYVGCFAVFSDYMKPAIRMAAISELPSIYLFSHDSIALGEDGPTHQPVEQLAMLRSIPNLNVLRPCDEREVYASYLLALNSTKTPTALILSRQGLPLLESSSVDGTLKGAYVVYEDKKDNDYQIIATGSEVALAINAAKELANEGINVKVISMPSMEVFAKQSEQYKSSVLTLPRDKTISLEMLSSFGWGDLAKYHISINRYGESAPSKAVLNEFGFTVEGVKNFIKGL